MLTRPGWELMFWAQEVRVDWEEEQSSRGWLPLPRGQAGPPAGLSALAPPPPPAWPPPPAPPPPARPPPPHARRRDEAPVVPQQPPPRQQLQLQSVRQDAATPARQERGRPRSPEPQQLRPAGSDPPSSNTQLPGSSRGGAVRAVHACICGLPRPRSCPGRGPPDEHRRRYARCWAQLRRAGGSTWESACCCTRSRKTSRTCWRPSCGQCQPTRSEP